MDGNGPKALQLLLIDHAVWIPMHTFGQLFDARERARMMSVPTAGGNPGALATIAETTNAVRRYAGRRRLQECFRGKGTRRGAKGADPERGGEALHREGIRRRIHAGDRGGAGHDAYRRLLLLQEQGRDPDGAGRRGHVAGEAPFESSHIGVGYRPEGMAAYAGPSAHDADSQPPQRIPRYRPDRAAV